MLMSRSKFSFTFLMFSALKKKPQFIALFCIASQLLDSFASLSPGAFAVILTAGSHRQGDESRDHPEAAGTQLWSNWEHKQLPQPVCSAAHECQVVWIALLYLCPRIIKVIFCSHLSAWLLLLHPVLPLVTTHPSSSFVLPSLPALTFELLLLQPPLLFDHLLYIPSSYSFSLA